MGYELQKLNARHLVMVRMKLRGMTNVQIAKALDMNEATVGMISNTGVFQMEMARRLQEIEKISDEDIANNLSIARGMLEREAIPSVQALADCRDSGDPHLKRQAAKDILTLAFARENSAPAGGQLQQTIVMNANQIAFLNQVVKEAGLGSDTSTNGDGNGNGAGTNVAGDRELQKAV